MAVQITIQGTIVNFPSSGEPQNWSSPIVEFAQLVESALLSAVGPYDIAPQTFNIDAYNAGSTIIPNLEFNNSVVRSASVIISTYRSNTSPSVTVSETSEITIVYNPTGPTGNKWEIARERVGNSSITFTISDAGQFSFTTTSIGAGTHSGVISFAAKALTQV
jgi:hypothetical protein